MTGTFAPQAFAVARVPATQTGRQLQALTLRRVGGIACTIVRLNVSAAVCSLASITRTSCYKSQRVTSHKFRDFASSVMRQYGLAGRHCVAQSTHSDEHGTATLRAIWLTTATTRTARDRRVRWICTPQFAAIHRLVRSDAPCGVSRLASSDHEALASAVLLLADRGNRSRTEPETCHHARSGERAVSSMESRDGVAAGDRRRPQDALGRPVLGRSLVAGRSRPVSPRVGGVLIRWDSGFAAGLSDSELRSMGKRWQTLRTRRPTRRATSNTCSSRGRGPIPAPRQPPRTADWGVSVFEFEPLAHAAIHRGSRSRPATRMQRRCGARTVANVDLPARVRGTRECASSCRVPLPIAGLEVFWARLAAAPTRRSRSRRPHGICSPKIPNRSATRFVSRCTRSADRSPSCAWSSVGAAPACDQPTASARARRA